MKACSVQGIGHLLAQHRACGDHRDWVTPHSKTLQLKTLCMICCELHEMSPIAVWLNYRQISKLALRLHSCKQVDLAPSGRSREVTWQECSNELISSGCAHGWVRGVVYQQKKPLLHSLHVERDGMLENIHHRKLFSCAAKLQVLGPAKWDGAQWSLDPSSHNDGQWTWFSAAVPPSWYQIILIVCFSVIGI